MHFNDIMSLQRLLNTNIYLYLPGIVDFVLSCLSEIYIERTEKVVGFAKYDALSIFAYRRDLNYKG